MNYKTRRYVTIAALIGLLALIIFSGL
jgi:hypothetical protein